MILLDTHALYWLATGDKKLGRTSRARIDQALAADKLAVSAISFWELAMLASKKRIEANDIEEMRRIALESGIIELPLDGPAASANGSRSKGSAHPPARAHRPCR